MKTLILILRSRTVWTILAMFVIGGLEAINPFIPQDAYIVLQGGLSLLAVYFRINPSQKYK